MICIKKTFRLKNVFARNRVWTVIGEGTVYIDCLLFHKEEEIKKERQKKETRNVRNQELDVKQTHIYIDGVYKEKPLPPKKQF